MNELKPIKVYIFCNFWRILIIIINSIYILRIFNINIQLKKFQHKQTTIWWREDHKIASLLLYQIDLVYKKNK